MRAKDLINYTIPPLKLSDQIDKARSWMSEFHIRELPVIDSGKFLGLFNENVLFDEVSDTQTIADFQLIGAHIHVDQNEHYYEVIKKAYDAHSHVVAVLNENEEYLGSVSIEDVVEAFSKMSSIRSPGTIIVLSIPVQDYSMTEISKIIESEGGKVLSSFVDNVDDQLGIISVTLKLNIDKASSIISSFERYGYKISATFGHESDDTFEEERLDTLMRYLKV